MVSRSQNYFRSRDNHFRFDGNRKYCRLNSQVNNPNVWTDGRKVLPVTFNVEYSLPVEPEVVFRSSADVPQHSASGCWRLYNVIRALREKIGNRQPFLAKPEVEIWRKPHKRIRGTRLPIRLFMEGSVVPSNTKSPGPRPTTIPRVILMHAAIWPQQIWAENWGEAVPLWGGEVGLQSPSNTIYPGPMPTRIPCFVLIHPTVWPQCTNVTDRQTDRQDNGPIA